MRFEQRLPGRQHRDGAFSRARAQVGFRLVPNQDPKDMHAKLRRHLDAKGFGDIEITAEPGSHWPVPTLTIPW